MPKRKNAPSKIDSLDDPGENRPPLEEVDDPVTLAKLDALKAPDDLDSSEPSEKLLKRIPEAQRPEVHHAIKTRIARGRAYIYGEVEDADW